MSQSKTSERREGSPKQSAYQRLSSFTTASSFIPQPSLTYSYITLSYNYSDDLSLFTYFYWFTVAFRILWSASSGQAGCSSVGSEVIWAQEMLE